MSLPFSLFLALKYLRPRRNTVSVVVLLTVIGISFGVALPLVVLSVMNGFGELWNNKFLSFSDHISITRYTDSVSADPEIMKIIESEEGVIGVSPVIRTLVLARKRNTTTPVMVIGLDPDRFSQVSGVSTSIVQGASSIDFGELLVGKHLANRLFIRPGDKLLLYTARSVTAQDEVILPDEPEVGGIFKVGQYDFDSRFIITSLDTARDLMGIDQGATAYRVMVEDPLKPYRYVENLQKKLGQGYLISTWMEAEENSIILGAIQNEKRMMTFVMMIIAVVATFCVSATLFVVAIEKTHEIGVLKSLGVASRDIAGVFIAYGCILSSIGVSLGTVFGLLLLHFRNNIVDFIFNRFGQEIFPPEIYAFDGIPARIDKMDVILIVGFVMVFSLVASLMPALRSALMRPVDALKG
jgi:lipoprotein-releasing system permease protein